MFQDRECASEREGSLSARAISGRRATAVAVYVRRGSEA